MFPFAVPVWSSRLLSYVLSTTGRKYDRVLGYGIVWYLGIELPFCFWLLLSFRSHGGSADSLPASLCNSCIGWLGASVYIVLVYYDPLIRCYYLTATASVRVGIAEDDSAFLDFRVENFKLKHYIILSLWLFWVLYACYSYIVNFRFASVWHFHFSPTGATTVDCPAVVVAALMGQPPNPQLASSRPVCKPYALCRLLVTGSHTAGTLELQVSGSLAV